MRLEGTPRAMYFKESRIQVFVNLLSLVFVDGLCGRQFSSRDMDDGLFVGLMSAILGL